jgi:predicted nucleic acid-binding protein
MENWVIVDTCVWASFFGKPGSPEKAAVDDLLDADRVALTGPILGEVLLGFRRKDQADWVASRLRLAHDIKIEWDDWRMAAHLGRELTASGNQLPLTDLVVAAVAIRCQAWVYTTDPHFDLIANLKRYAPGAGHAND